MAPYRGRGGGRGTGGRGRGGRGGFATRGGGGNGKLARSGIKTRSGYRKFDSQRLREVESDSDDGMAEVQDDAFGEIEVSSDDEDEVAPAVKAYSTLIASFAQPQNGDGRRRKRRKLEVNEDVMHVGSGRSVGEGSLQGLEEESGDEADMDMLDQGADDEGELADDDDEVEDHTDPFEIHFANPDEDELSRRLKSLQADPSKWRSERHVSKALGQCEVSVPQCVGPASPVRKPVVKSTASLRLKRRLQTPARTYIGDLDESQQMLAPYMTNYQDILLSGRTAHNASSFRDLAALHAVNHVLKGRDKLLKNNERLKSASEDLDIRDQGFTRPKVLMLCETRQMAAAYVSAIKFIFGPMQQDNKQRFESSFTAPIDTSSTMPEDFQELFQGNNDNNFLTALKLTRKTLKFFSAFYASDIIIASPLGLRGVIENEDSKKRDFDFLSSIEICIVDQADAMQMQSWENVEVVFKHLNAPLREAHNADFSRVRNYYLDGHAKFLRQTLVSTAYITPETNRLFHNDMKNVAGKVKITPHYAGVIANAGGLGIKQTFSRFSSTTPAFDPDARFQYFTAAVLPSLLRLPKPAEGGQGILIFIPSYFDFLRIRNFFATSTLTANTSFGTVHDYTEPSDQRRARSHFLSGRHSILLYTQRAHHFFRLRMKGVKRVVMYGLPDNPIFYEELVGGFLGSSLRAGKAGREECAVRAMFSKWDVLRLRRVVGDARVKGMLGSTGDTFDFV